MIGIGFPPVGFLTALMCLVASGRRLSAKKASKMKDHTFVEHRTANSLAKYCGRGRCAACHPKTVARSKFWSLRNLSFLIHFLFGRMAGARPWFIHGRWG